MDMKRFLQAVDGSIKSSSQPDDEMKKFVSIITEGKGKLNRLTQAETIALNHYTKPVDRKEEIKEQTSKSGIHKFFKAVEQELLEDAQQELSEKQIKVQQLAERAIKEVGNNGHFSNLKKHLSRSKKLSSSIHSLAIQGARIDNKTRKRQRHLHHETANQEDSVTLNIPLLIRIVEYAREDAKTDVDLHSIVENMLKLSQEGQTLTMDHYDSIVKRDDTVSEDSDPCWKNYKQVGTKKKGGKTVPNCVPKK